MEFKELSEQERAEMRKKYPHVRFPNPIMEPLWFGRRPEGRVEGKWAIVDQDPADDHTRGVIAICSSDYKIVFYEDLIQMTEVVLDNFSGEYGKVDICPSIYSDGGRMNIRLKFPDMKEEIRKGDVIIPKIEIGTSLDLSTKLNGRFGLFQLRCSNGAGTWKTFSTFSRRHLQNLDITELADTVQSGLFTFEAQKKEWKQWAEFKIDLPVYEPLWADLPFSSTEKEKIETLSETGTQQTIKGLLEHKDLTLWSLNSIITQFVTHEIKSAVRKIDIEPLIAKVMETVFDRRVHA
jgi:hypothetical protein